MKNTFRVVALVSYVLIILAGDMTGIPFICWLFFASFDFGNIDQIFAISGIVGLLLNLTKWRNNILVSILCFALMLSPLISRIVQVPIEKFNYLTFQIPLTIFILTYLTFIFISLKQRKTDNH